MTASTASRKNVLTVLNHAFQDSGLTLAQIGKALGYSSHVAVWQYLKGKSRIPLESAYDLGLAVGMTPEQAQSFFLLNLGARAPGVYKIVRQIIAVKVAEASAETPE